MSAPAPRRPLAASVARQLGGAVVLVALAAVAFQAVGSIGDVEVVADDAAEDDRADAGDPVGEAGDPDASDDPDAMDEPDDADPADRPPVGDDPDDDARPGSDEGEDEAPDDAADGDDPPADGDDPPADDPSPDRLDPATITVQVLDGYQQDGGAAADAVADEVEAAGYDLIARNPALRYDVTTVLWTSGNEAAARQVAADIGAAEVRAQPGTLSEDVSVHVVVGADRG